GFSAAEPGRTIPPAVFDSSSLRRMTTRSCRGRSFIVDLSQSVVFIGRCRHRRVEASGVAGEGPHQANPLCHVWWKPTRNLAVTHTCGRQNQLQGFSEKIFHRIARQRIFHWPIRGKPAPPVQRLLEVSAEPGGAGLPGYRSAASGYLLVVATLVLALDHVGTMTGIRPGLERIVLERPLAHGLGF